MTILKRNVILNKTITKHKTYYMYMYYRYQKRIVDVKAFIDWNLYSTTDKPT